MWAPARCSKAEDVNTRPRRTGAHGGTSRRLCATGKASIPSAPHCQTPSWCFDAVTQRWPRRDACALAPSKGPTSQGALVLIDNALLTVAFHTSEMQKHGDQAWPTRGTTACSDERGESDRSAGWTPFLMGCAGHIHSAKNRLKKHDDQVCDLLRTQLPLPDRSPHVPINAKQSYSLVWHD